MQEEPTAKEIIANIFRYFPETKKILQEMSEEEDKEDWKKPQDPEDIVYKVTALGVGAAHFGMDQTHRVKQVLLLHEKEVKEAVAIQILSAMGIIEYTPNDEDLLKE